MLIGHSTTTPPYLVQTSSKYLEINVARTEIGQKVIPVQDSSDPATGLKEINSIRALSLRTAVCSLQALASVSSHTQSLQRPSVVW